MNNIPKAIIEKAITLIDKYGCHFRYIGNLNENEVYIYVFPKNERMGFPFVYLYDKEKNNAEELTGIEALKLLKSI